MGNPPRKCGGVEATLIMTQSKATGRGSVDQDLLGLEEDKSTVKGGSSSSAETEGGQYVNRSPGNRIHSRASTLERHKFCPILLNHRDLYFVLG